MDEWDYYPYVEKPFDNQLNYLRNHANDEYHALFWEMGAGKSKAIIDNVCYLNDLGEVDGLIVIALNGVHSNWALRELVHHVPSHVSHTVFCWGGNRNTKAWKESWQQLLDYEELAILCINVEALSHASGLRACTEFLSSRSSVFGVVDESSTIKDPKSNRTKNVIKLRDKCKYRRVLSGTPITQSPFDAFTQAQFLAKGLLGFPTYWSFKHRYAEFRTRIMGARQFQEVVRYRNLEELKAKLNEFSTFEAKSADIPPKFHMVRHVPMHKEQQKLYEQMRDIYSVELASGQYIETENALGKLQKLMQILSGHIIDSDLGIATAIPNHRLDALCNAIDECSGKIIIWSHFKKSLKDIVVHLKGVYGLDTVVEYHGGTAQADRELAIEQFQDPNSSVRFFVANQASAGYGLTLTEASWEFYYTNSYSLEQRLQSEDRAHRPGQTKHLGIVDFVIPGTIDEKVREALVTKVDIAQQITGLLKGWLV